MRGIRLTVFRAWTKTLSEKYVCQCYVWDDELKMLRWGGKDLPTESDMLMRCGWIDRASRIELWAFSRAALAIVVATVVATIVKI